MQDKIKKVNEMLKAGEPKNITKDVYSGYTGYSPQYVIDTMNQVMLGEWGFEEISNKFIDKDENGKPVQAISQIKVWLSGIDFKPVAYGTAKILRGSYGDAKKSAQTDALKKALSYFSIGNRAYHGLLKKD
jgi:hypothetical protein